MGTCIVYGTGGSYKKNVTSVTLNKISASLEIGDTLQLVATVLPVNAANKTLVWNSDNTNISIITDPENNSICTVRGLVKGNVIITATAIDGSGKSASCNLSVTQDISYWDGSTIAASFATGTGTEADPYLVQNANEFMLYYTLTDATYNNKFFRLTSSIDLAGKTFVMTTIRAAIVTNLDGGYNIIRNFNSNGNEYFITSGSLAGYIKKVGFYNFITKGGVLAFSKVDECFAYNGTVNASNNGNVAGGLSSTQCNMTNSYARVKLNSAVYVSGIQSHFNGNSLSNCWAACIYVGGTNKFGIGSSTGMAGMISNCYYDSSTAGFSLTGSMQGIPKSTEQMKNADYTISTSFLEVAGRYQELAGFANNGTAYSKSVSLESVS